jgi:hypothetical protein
MGTDIHVAVERREYAGNRRSRWLCVPEAPPEARDPFWTRRAREKPDDAWLAEFQKRWYTDRNYEAFAILADVRNGKGFAGVDTGDGFEPIAQPRGLPSNISDELRTITNKRALDECGVDTSDILAVDDVAIDEVEGEFWLGDHSYSYLTVAELLAYDWTGQSTKLRGVIPLAEWLDREQRGETRPPPSYCGSTDGPGIRTITQRKARRQIIEHGVVAEAPGERLHVQAEWVETYAQAAGAFYSRVLPALVKLDPNPENVRIVFGFDS